jgi:hypothetical protein
MPRIISIAIRKIMNDPAMAKDEISTPKTPRRGAPMNKNEQKIRKETRVTFADFTSPDLDLISIIIGIDPGISIMAKRTIKAANISRKSKCIFFFYYLTSPQPLPQEGGLLIANSLLPFSFRRRGWGMRS